MLILTIILKLIQESIPLMNLYKKIIKQNKSRNNLSFRKRAKLYFEETRKKISKIYANNLIKNNFKLAYLKTSIKINKVNNDSCIFSTFYFIKSLIKYLSLGFKLIFLDEISILSINNNYWSWLSKSSKKQKNLFPKLKTLRFRG